MFISQKLFFIFLTNSPARLYHWIQDKCKSRDYSPRVLRWEILPVLQRKCYGQEDESANHWWDKLGKPQYGGELHIRTNRKIANFDPYYGVHLTQVYTAWMEKMFTPDWLMDPLVNDFREGERRIILSAATSPKARNLPTLILLSSMSAKGCTGKICRRPTVENLSPRILSSISTGCTVSAAAMTKPSPARADIVAFKELISVTAPDKYTVIFKWKTSSRELILDALQEIGTSLCIENPEVVKQYGDTRDWHHAVGTGPFMLKEFVPDVSATVDQKSGLLGS